MNEEEDDWHKIKEKARAATQHGNEHCAPSISQCPPPPPPTPAVGGTTPGQNVCLPGNTPGSDKDKEGSSRNVFSLKETITKKLHALKHKNSSVKETVNKPQKVLFVGAGKVTKVTGFSCTFCTRMFRSRHDVKIH